MMKSVTAMYTMRMARGCCLGHGHHHHHHHQPLSRVSCNVGVVGAADAAAVTVKRMIATNASMKSFHARSRNTVLTAVTAVSVTSLHSHLPLPSWILTPTGSTSTCSGSSIPMNCTPRYFSTKNHPHHTHRPHRAFSSSTSSSSTSNERAYEGVTDEVSKLITHYARQPQTPVSLQTLLQTGRGDFLHKTYKQLEDDDDNYDKDNDKDDDNDNDKEDHDGVKNQRGATGKVLIQVASFLRRELPIRLAHRIADLERVPYLSQMPSVVGVKKLYTQSFLELTSFQERVTNVNAEEEFSILVERIYNRHSKVLVQMARGAYEFRDAIRLGHFSDLDSRTVQTFDQMESTHEFLDRFYLCRIGIRVLIGQYLALRQSPMENYIGLICSHTSPYEITMRAIEDATFMCTRKYGDAPEVIISGRLEQTFPYIPTHLHYILLELLKNSMRATVDWHGVDGDYPPIKVVIADGDDNEDVIIKVSDEGGGIPRSNMKKIWSYLFTTADPAIQRGMVLLNPTNDHAIDSPLAGLGYGLPISRSYCRYFGGDLSIMSMEGHGTDAFVYLARLGNMREPVPI